MKKLITDEDVAAAAMHLLAAGIEINTNTLYGHLQRGSKSTIAHAWLRVQPVIERNLRAAGALPQTSEAESLFQSLVTSVRQAERSRLSSEWEVLEQEHLDARSAERDAAAEERQALLARIHGLEQARLEAEVARGEAEKAAQAAHDRGQHLDTDLASARAEVIRLRESLERETAMVAAIRAESERAVQSGLRHIEDLKAASKAAAEQASATESRLTIALANAQHDFEKERGEFRRRMEAATDTINQGNVTIASLRERVIRLEAQSAEAARTAEAVALRADAELQRLRATLDARESELASARAKAEDLAVQTAVLAARLDVAESSVKDLTLLLSKIPPPSEQETAG